MFDQTRKQRDSTDATWEIKSNAAFGKPPSVPLSVSMMYETGVKYNATNRTMNTTQKRDLLTLSSDAHPTTKDMLSYVRQS